MTDTDLVRTICALVADRPGDPASLVRAEVLRLAPLCSDDERQRLTDRAVAHLRGLGELDDHLRDAGIDEVMVNADREIWVDRDGSLARVGRLDQGRIELLVERALAPIGRRVDRSSPIVDARLEDGSRLCAVLPPVALDGPVLSIRRFRPRVLPLDAFTGTAGTALLREVVVERRCNIVVSGSTSSGKTSLVAALLHEIDPRERVLLVEDTAEIPLRDRHGVRLEARPASADGPAAVDLAQLVRTALRLRPDRLVVGEVRGDEVLALVQAMNTGHDGSMATCHANGPLDALLRLESLVLAAAPAWPLDAIRQQLTRSLDVVVHVERHTHSSRRVAAVSEIEIPPPMPNASVALRPLARIDAEGDLVVEADPTRTRR